MQERREMQYEHRHPNSIQLFVPFAMKHFSFLPRTISEWTSLCVDVSAAMPNLEICNWCKCYVHCSVFWLQISLSIIFL